MGNVAPMIEDKSFVIIKSGWKVINTNKFMTPDGSSDIILKFDHIIRLNAN